MAEQDKKYDAKKKCPKCGKRKVYYSFDVDKVIYVCTACNRTWRG